MAISMLSPRRGFAMVEVTINDPRTVVRLAASATRGYDTKTMRRASPRAVADLLVAAVPALGDRLAEERIRRAWSAVVGPEIGRRSQPRAFVDGCLTVTVDNSPWLHELTLRRDELLARLRERFAGVRALRLELGRLEAAGGEPPPREPRRAATRLDAADRRAIDEAVRAIGDPELAEAARRLMTKAWRAR